MNGLEFNYQYRKHTNYNILTLRAILARVRRQLESTAIPPFCRLRDVRRRHASPEQFSREANTVFVLNSPEPHRLDESHRYLGVLSTSLELAASLEYATILPYCRLC